MNEQFVCVCVCVCVGFSNGTVKNQKMINTWQKYGKCEILLKIIFLIYKYIQKVIILSKNKDVFWDLEHVKA